MLSRSGKLVVGWELRASWAFGKAWLGGGPHLGMCSSRHTSAWGLQAAGNKMKSSQEG